jgi:pimeloyl-ACP methyl ester carboxylesterase
LEIVAPASGEQAMTDTARVSLGEIELGVYDQGGRDTPARPPILFVHGFPLDHTMWQSQFDAFSPNFRVIAPDLRGFGKSTVTDGVVSMRQMADDLAALLDVLAIRRPVVLCGLSMGGYVAFEFLRTYGPRVRALILCDTRSAADTPEAAANRHKTAEVALSHGASPVAEGMLPKLIAPASLAGQPRVVESLKRMMRTTDPRAMAAALRGMAARADSTPLLTSIRVPTLVLVGQHDAISSLAEMRQMAARIPNARCVVIPDAGHMSPMENPSAVNAAIREFLDAVEAAKP